MPASHSGDVVIEISRANISESLAFDTVEESVAEEWMRNGVDASFATSHIDSLAVGQRWVVAIFVDWIPMETIEATVFNWISEVANVIDITLMLIGQVNHILRIVEEGTGALFDIAFCQIRMFAFTRFEAEVKSRSAFSDNSYSGHALDIVRATGCMG